MESLTPAAQGLQRYGARTEPLRYMDQPSRYMDQPSRLRLMNGLACAGFSAMISGALLVVLQNPSLTTTGDTSVVAVLLTLWLLYHFLRDSGPDASSGA